MATEMRLNREWATRPSDERFLSLPELHDAQLTLRQRSMSAVKHLSELHVRADRDQDQLLLCTSKSEAQPTNWAFSQLCSLVGAPSGYMRELPVELAAGCLNSSLATTARSRAADDCNSLLVSRGDQSIKVRAINSDSYGRIWDHQVTKALIDFVGDGRTGDFRVPGEFGRKVEVTKQNTTIYGGDRSMFVFLADEDRRIEVPNRRDGQPGSMARGFMVSNSEVGGGTLRADYLLFDYVCSNRIIWGAQQMKTLKIRHTSGAPDRFIYEALPQLEAFSRATDIDVIGRIKAAQRAVPHDMNRFLLDRFGRAAAQRIQAAHLQDEGRPIKSLWDAVTGATAAARAITWQDERVKLEIDAGKILDLVTVE